MEMQNKSDDFKAIQIYDELELSSPIYESPCYWQ